MFGEADHEVAAVAEDLVHGDRQAGVPFEMAMHSRGVLFVAALERDGSEVNDVVRFEQFGQEALVMA